MITTFKIGESYNTVDPQEGSVYVECIKRTERTVTFMYDDGEVVKKVIKVVPWSVGKYSESVKFDGYLLKA